MLLAICENCSTVGTTICNVGCLSSRRIAEDIMYPEDIRMSHTMRRLRAWEKKMGLAEARWEVGLCAENVDRFGKRMASLEMEAA